MRREDWEAIPLMRRIYFLDSASGLHYVSEVRRDPTSGLTLSVRYPLRDYQPTSTTKETTHEQV